MTQLLKKTYDLVVVGAGPGGFAAAAKAAYEGMKVAVIDKREYPGGTCTSVGCIPSKALLYATKLYKQTKELVTKRGTIINGEVSFDFGKIQEDKNRTVMIHHQALLQTLIDRKIDHFMSTAGRMMSPHQVQLMGGSADGKVLEAKNIVISPGSKTIELPFLPVDEKLVFTSTGLVNLNRIPKKLTILGAGIIGLELGSVFARLGTEVTFIEMLEKIGSQFADPEVSDLFRHEMEMKEGLRFHLGTAALGADIDHKKNEVTIHTTGGDVTSDAVLVSVGRVANTRGFGLGDIGVQFSRTGLVEVDKNLETTVRSVYCIGDSVPGPMIAHKATMEANAVIDHLLGKPTKLEYGSLPCVMYTHPEFGWCGKNSETLAKEGTSFKAYRFDYNSEMRDPLCESLEGFMKVLVDANTEKVLGMQVIGATAGDIVPEASLAIMKGCTIHEFGNSAHAHPFYKSFRTMFRTGIFH
jgi:dihydrolipoamide dehydrogenase